MYVAVNLNHAGEEKSDESAGRDGGGNTIESPVKSLLRFSSVSKTWKSIIWKSWFVKRYRRRAVLPGRERIVLIYSRFRSFIPLQTSVPTDNDVSSSCGRSFECKFSELLASCGELWLTRYSDSLYLWNPSMRRHKIIPNPHAHAGGSFFFPFEYGLGYDSVGDDYKILKILKSDYGRFVHCSAMLYSLRSNSWRESPSFSRDMEPKHGRRCVFVSGNIHWLPCDQVRRVIISFDLSTEKFGEVNYPPTMKEKASLINVLRGMLCVTVKVDKKCVIWMMEEYGVTRSWNIKFTIKYYSDVDPISCVRPLYFYENGAILVRGRRERSKKYKVFIHQDEKTGLQELSYGSNAFNITRGIPYADSLVAPVAWSALV